MAIEKNLSAKDICSIINACKASGVRKLLYLGLSLEFTSEPDTAHHLLPVSGWNEEEISSLSPTELDQNQIDPAQLEDLQVTDPVSWEKYRTEG